MRGQHSFTALFAALILIMTLLLILGIVRVVKSHYDTLEEDLGCGAQILAHHVAVQKTGEAAAPTIKCPTKRVTVAEGEANEAIAKEMARCWTMWGRGELQLFGEDEGLYCHICSTVMVEDAQFVGGLPEYLETQKHHTGKTYAEYLTGTEEGTYFEAEDVPDQAPAAFPTEKPIAIIMYYAKGNEFYKDMYNALIGRPDQAAAQGYATGYLVTGVLFAPGLNPISEVIRQAGGAAGASAGVLASLQARIPNSYATIVVVRPLAEEEIGTLGCQYAPVAN